MSPEEEIELLRERVERLESRVSALVELPERRGIGEPVAELPSAGVVEPRDGSPYRDAPPRTKASDVRCSRCGTWLEVDEPDMALAGEGRVCTSCFVRG